MKLLVVLVAFLSALTKVIAVFNVASDKVRRLVAEDPHEGAPSTSTATEFLNGNLGAINLPANSFQYAGASDSTFRLAAVNAIKSILVENFSASGDEVVKPTNHKIPVDKDGSIHMRFKQYIKGYPVAGASMMMHIKSKEGTVYALNGEFSPSHAIDLRVLIACNESMETALAQSGIKNGKWLTDCEEAAVRGFDGLAHLAHQRLVGYRVEGSPYQKTYVYASTVTGDLLALHPQTKGGRSLQTWDCKGTWGYFCKVKSNSPDPMTLGNPGVVAAHNYAIATHDFYMSEYGRDSLDDQGMKLVSYANVGDENNAWWDGYSMSYGGGDGIEFYPFSLSADVVAHEITHGVTQFSSNLLYWEESGAINEAMSDIFGAVVERAHLTKSVNDTWLLGEDLFIMGGAIRNMQDPASFGNADYYPHRYRGWEDGGGVHNNSGIANLAFALMVQGGEHPRKKTNVTVPAIDPTDFDASMKAAAAIFYYVNTQCLTESSSFASLRACTLMFAGEHEDTVGAAWDAVGVSEKVFTRLQDGVEVTGQSAVWGKVLEYSLDGVKAGETVTCVTEADNGDVDLFVRFDKPPDPNFRSSFNDCASGTDGSNEECTTGLAWMDNTIAYSAVDAYADYSDLSISCFRAPAEYLSIGTPVSGHQDTVGGIKYFVVDLYSSYGPYEGDQFSCATSGNNGDADLFFKFGSLPSPYGSYDCESTAGGTSNESCTATYTFKGVVSNSNRAFVAIYSSDDYEDLTVQCVKLLPFWYIIDGEIYDYLWNEFSVQRFVMDGVKAGKKVTCTLAGDGDADLYVRFGQEAEPYDWSTENDCMSLGLSTSQEKCATGAAPVDTSVYVAVAAKQSYWSLSLTCSISSIAPRCKAKGAVCASRTQCCSVGGSKLACDGYKGGRRVCKTCRKINQKCDRSSQCCGGLCRNKRCKKKT